ncbi:MAG: hypothetical protein US69_C0022G0013 [candidate division TM6 bacterium GW2011_GWF2_38_10]|nr:MAG: hypothetical protein US69_C0022G0013 [candidate division TM6 bacterium GW2011_GWF2_38_10]
MEKRLIRSLIIGGVFLLCVRAADAHFLFSNRNASIVLQEDSSLVLNAPVYGWKDRSITKYISDDGGIDLREEYHDGTGRISFEDAPTELVYNNSNAIAAFDTDVRNNSNAIVTLDTNVRLNSNAFAYAAEDLATDIRYNSNAIVNIEATNNAAHEALAASSSS